MLLKSGCEFQPRIRFLLLARENRRALPPGAALEEYQPRYFTEWFCPPNIMANDKVEAMRSASPRYGVAPVGKRLRDQSGLATTLRVALAGRFEAPYNRLTLVWRAHNLLESR